MDNEEKYIDIAAKLKDLDKVEASHNFTHNLQAKIIEFESEKRKEHAKRNEETKGGFLKDLFGNLQYPWIVPVAGFTILIFFVFYITYQNKNIIEHSNNNQNTPEFSEKIQPPDPDKSVENRIPPAITDNKELSPDISQQSEKKSTLEKSETSRNNIKRTEEYAADVKPESKYENKVSVQTSKDTEHKIPVVPEVKEEEKVTENQGMVSEEKTSTMAKVIPESKDTNSGRKEMNTDLRSMMLKINKIDKEALEKIHEEISR